VLGTAEDPHGEESDVSPFQGKTQVDAFLQELRQEKIADRARSGFTFGQLFTCSISFRKLTHVNVNERLTCDQILDLLKSEKWPNEINTMIQQNKKVPRLQSKQFEKMLTSKTGEEINAMVAFTSTAVGASESRIVCQRTQLDQKYYLLFSFRFSNCTEPEIFDCRCSYRTTATILTI
jgi:hypothetical protein